MQTNACTNKLVTGDRSGDEAINRSVGFVNLEQEITVGELPVQGNFPEWLTGTLLLVCIKSSIKQKFWPENYYAFKKSRINFLRLKGSVFYVKFPIRIKNIINQESRRKTCSTR